MGRTVYKYFPTADGVVAQGVRGALDEGGDLGPHQRRGEVGGRRPVELRVPRRSSTS